MQLVMSCARTIICNRCDSHVWFDGKNSQLKELKDFFFTDVWTPLSTRLQCAIFRRSFCERSFSFHSLLLLIFRLIVCGWGCVLILLTRKPCNFHLCNASLKGCKKGFCLNGNEIELWFLCETSFWILWLRRYEETNVVFPKQIKDAI